jgi:hypothetical protein
VVKATSISMASSPIAAITRSTIWSAAPDQA